METNSCTTELSYQSFIVVLLHHIGMLSIFHKLSIAEVQFSFEFSACWHTHFVFADLQEVEIVPLALRSFDLVILHGMVFDLLIDCVLETSIILTNIHL